MKMYVARHAQTNYNVASLCNADPTVDVHLTEVGIEQAKQLAKKLAGVEFDAIYISELPRTRETASYLEQYRTAPVIVDARLNDVQSGFEGRPIVEYVTAFNNAPNSWHATFNDGESIANVKQRLQDFVEHLQSKPHKSVLTITHGTPIECLHGALNGLSFEEAATFQIGQGDYYLYEL